MKRPSLEMRGGQADNIPRLFCAAVAQLCETFQEEAIKRKNATLIS